MSKIVIEIRKFPKPVNAEAQIRQHQFNDNFQIVGWLIPGPTDPAPAEMPKPVELNFTVRYEAINSEARRSARLHALMKFLDEVAAQHPEAL